MSENRKCPFCGKTMVCVNTQDGEFTCTSCAEYANHDVLDFIEELQAENERLLKIVRHQKYKRCLARALLALEERETCKIEYEELYIKWYKRWKALADKFKEK